MGLFLYVCKLNFILQLYVFGDVLVFCIFCKRNIILIFVVFIVFEIIFSLDRIVWFMLVFGILFKLFFLIVKYLFLILLLFVIFKIILLKQELGLFLNLNFQCNVMFWLNNIFILVGGVVVNLMELFFESKKKIKIVMVII